MTTVMDDRTIIFNLKEAGRVGPRTMLTLLDYFGSPEAVWEAEPEELSQIPRIGEKTIERIIEGQKLIDETREQMAGLDEQDVHIITILDPEYPPRLAKIGDPPSVLFVRGEIDWQAGPVVAIVGTHEADETGIMSAENLGAAIAKRGAVVVSGLARGIDAAAHVGTIQAGGTTIGVLGCGFARMYPPENSLLAGQVAENGAVISEYNPQTRITVGRLMARNRIVVGLADAVLIIQVHETSSGTMDAATRAHQQSKPIFIVDRPKIPQIGQLKAHGGIVVDEKNCADWVLKYR